MEWKDRVPTKANRKKITFEDTTLGTKYATVEYADEPSEVGTALNKSNLLQGFNNVECKKVTVNANINWLNTPSVETYYLNVDFGYVPNAFLILAYKHECSGTYTYTHDPNYPPYGETSITESVSGTFEKEVFFWSCGDKIKFENLSYRAGAEFNMKNLEVTDEGKMKLTYELDGARPTGGADYKTTNVFSFYMIIFKKPIE